MLSSMELSYMYKFCNVTNKFLQYIFFVFLKSLRSSVSEGIRAVDERMSKQVDIREKKVRTSVAWTPWSTWEPGPTVWTAPPGPSRRGSVRLGLRHQ